MIFDTSGAVTLNSDQADGAGVPHDPGCYIPVRWAQLAHKPFVQGYIRALMRELYGDPPNRFMTRPPAYGDLAAETLAKIMKDCTKAVEMRSIPFGRHYNDNEAGGACFWEDRQAGGMREFPPLTVRYDAPGGKIVLEPGR